MTDLVATRLDLQRVATHVMARRRHAVCARFGLRATPGGIGTPAFGPDEHIEVVRITPTALVHETGGHVHSHPLAGATLGQLADFVGVDLAKPFSVGQDTPAVGAVDEPLSLDPAAIGHLADWYGLGWRVLDDVTATAVNPDTVQLWPEHFDVGTIVDVGPGPDDRANVGASPGDRYVDEPYLYVQPWSGDRPGDAAYWNISFGAVLRRSECPTVDAGVAFIAAGLGYLTG